MLCPEVGCKRKYQSEISLLKHYNIVHGHAIDKLPEGIERCSTKAQREANSARQRGESLPQGSTKDPLALRIQAIQQGHQL